MLKELTPAELLWLASRLEKDDRFDEAEECYSEILCRTDLSPDMRVQAKAELIHLEYWRELRPLIRKRSNGQWRFIDRGSPFPTTRAFYFISRLNDLTELAIDPTLKGKILYMINGLYLFSHRNPDLRMQLLEEAFAYGNAYAGMDLALARHASRSSDSEKETKWILRQALRSASCSPRGANLVKLVLAKKIKMFGSRICPIDRSIITLWANLDHQHP